MLRTQMPEGGLKLHISILTESLNRGDDCNLLNLQNTQYLFDYTVGLWNGFNTLEVVDDQGFLNKRLALLAEYQREMSLAWVRPQTPHFVTYDSPRVYHTCIWLIMAQGYTCIDAPVMMGATVIRAILVL